MRGRAAVEPTGLITLVPTRPFESDPRKNQPPRAPGKAIFGRPCQGPSTAMTSTFQVHQVRYGLATNSSSTHSILILPGVGKDKEVDGGFGWGFFTAATQESKGLYAALQLRYALLSMFNEDIAQTVAQAWTGVDLTEPGSYEQYIDHQSTWVLPCAWDEKGIDKGFFDDLHAFLMREDVLVLGGNDNTNKRHPLTRKPNAQKVDFPLPLDGGSKGLVCRKDPTNGAWTLFNRNTGTKIRMSFGDGVNGGSVAPTKAHAPELVDLKITNWCGAGCEFCYQDSTPTGVHGDRDFIYSVLRALGTMRVFEVAIGGGEPTAHPDFVEILRMCRYHGMVPNFTTKARAWLHDHKRRLAILEHTGAFAFSIDTADDLADIASARDAYGISGSKVNCQLVMGTVNEYEFEEILEHAASRSMRLTLLGYKTNGRGSQVKPQDYSRWVEIFKTVLDRSRFGLKLGIDTALAQDSGPALEALGVPSWCYEVKEGAFSMYIDAVTRKTGPSSYGEALAMRPLKSKDAYSGLAEEILGHFVEY